MNALFTTHIRMKRLGDLDRKESPWPRLISIKDADDLVRGDGHVVGVDLAKAVVQVA
jgi:hypothetical protein